MPRQKTGNAIRGLAIAYERTEKLDLAVQHWSTLYRGMKRRTSEWIEASYHLILCHIRAGSLDSARKVLANFKMVFPRWSELTEWRPKFEALEKECVATKVNIKP
jgi:hypothetical protein